MSQVGVNLRLLVGKRVVQDGPGLPWFQIFSRRPRSLQCDPCYDSNFSVHSWAMSADADIHKSQYLCLASERVSFGHPPPPGSNVQSNAKRDAQYQNFTIKHPSEPLLSEHSGGPHPVASMISNILSTAACFPPAFLHNSPICCARVLNASDSFPGLTSLAIAVPNSTVSISGATFLLPNVPIPRYSARMAISYKSNHWARMIWGMPALLLGERQSRVTFACHKAHRAAS